jgi:hypothetical protein
MRTSAKRYAEPVLTPRTRPLLWRAKPNVLGTDITSASDETKSDT